MSQTTEGASKAKLTMKEKYGENYYAIIGQKGGEAGRGYAFGHGKVDPAAIGSKGGSLSRRGYRLTGYENGVPQYVKKV